MHRCIQGKGRRLCQNLKANSEQRFGSPGNLSECPPHPSATPDPINPEIVAIGYRGIAPWLTREITQFVGIGANLEYPFQSRAITKALRDLYRLAVDPNLSADNPWTANTMAWAIADLLPSFRDAPSFEPLRRFLEDSDEAPELLDHRRIDLSVQIANIFDRYLMYRPDWVLAWSRNEPAPSYSSSRTKPGSQSSGVH